MDSPVTLLALGFLLGTRHALDPDHVVAVTTIVTRNPSVARAVRVGALWGVGHSVTVLVIGGVIAAFRLVVSHRVAATLELGVAVMLIALGVANLRVRAAPATPSDARPLLIGMMHGLAGSAAVALLVLAAVTDTRVAIAYLALFGAGTVIAMTAVTGAMAMPLVAAARRVEHARRWLLAGSGVISIALGAWIAYSLLFPSGAPS